MSKPTRLRNTACAGLALAVCSLLSTTAAHSEATQSGIWKGSSYHFYFNSTKNTQTVTFTFCSNEHTAAHEFIGSLDQGELFSAATNPGTCLGGTVSLPPGHNLGVTTGCAEECSPTGTYQVSVSIQSLFPPKS